MSEPTTPLASDEMDASYDVVVVGGGGSGLSAAVQAARNGLSVALIEKMPVLGGCSAFAEGHAAFGSDEQAKRGINVTQAGRIRRAAGLLALAGRPGRGLPLRRQRRQDRRDPARHGHRVRGGQGGRRRRAERDLHLAHPRGADRPRDRGPRGSRPPARRRHLPLHRGRADRDGRRAVSRASSRRTRTANRSGSAPRPWSWAPAGSPATPRCSPTTRGTPPPAR